MSAIISLGIGSPSGIPEFLLLGLGVGEEAAVETISLTLLSRSTAITLEERSVTLTLPARSRQITLPASRG